MKTSLLIDGDEYLFKACAAVEREVRWDEWNHVLSANRADAWGNFVRMIEQLFERFDTKEHALCFSTLPNFRHSVSEDYKGGRAKTRKPLCYADLREDCANHYNVVDMAGIEADDVMGILATKPYSLYAGYPSTPSTIIVSQDKDMKTIPGKLFREGKVVTITEAAADFWHMYQTLIGDITDGYKGCPGLGPVKAAKILDTPNWTKESMWIGVVKAYEKAGLTETDALKQARLARILRWSDWDSNLKQPILWSPG